MGPQIIIFGLEFLIHLRQHERCFLTASKNKFPSCYSISRGNDSMFHTRSSSSVLPFLHISLLNLFWTLPALCSSPGQEEQLWSIVACYFTEEAAALPSQLSLFITSTQTGLQEHDEEMLQYTTKRFGNYTGHWKSLFVSIWSVLKQGYSPKEKGFMAIKPQVKRDNERAKPLKSTSVNQLLGFYWKITTRYGSVLSSNPVWHINRGSLKGEKDVWMENNQTAVCLLWPVYNYQLLSTWHMCTSVAIEIIYCL